MQSVRFSGVYGIKTQEAISQGGRRRFVMDDVRKALGEKAAQENVQLAMDPDVQKGSYIAVPHDQPVLPGFNGLRRNTPQFYVFTQDDLTAYQGFQADVETYWTAHGTTAENWANKASQKIRDSRSRMMKFADSADKVARVFGLGVALFAFTVTDAAKSVVDAVEGNREKAAANKILKKWAPLLSKLPKTDAFLPKEQVLKAIAENKFNVETGEIRP